MTLATPITLFPAADFVAVHRELATDADRCAAAGTATAGLRPLAFRVGEDAVTFLPGDPLRIVAGVDEAAGCVVTFTDAAAFSDFFHELRTVPGAQLSGTIRYERGGYGGFDEWEPALRALYQGRAVFDPAAVDRSRIDRTFTFGVDTVEEIGAFVAEFGFAVVRDVLSPDEVAAIDAAVSRLEHESTPDTPGTWWTTGPDGTARVCQIHYTTERAPEIAWIDADPRMTALVDASIPGLLPHADRGNGHFAVLKQPGASGGMTDLTWHIDCGLGGHTLLCPGLHIGIQLTASDPEVGAFAVLAGSHASSVRRGAVDEATWPVVVVHTRPGDVTIHDPHLMHAAPPPRGRGAGRRTLYLGYGRADAHDLLGPGRSFDDLLSATADDGFVSFDDGAARA